MVAVMALFLWLLPSVVQAATYYVATTGSNANSCAAAQSESTPKLTLADGVGCLSSGDTLIIKAGTYTGQQILNPPAGADGAYTTITGDRSGARPIIAPSGGTAASPGQTGFDCTGGSACRYIALEYIEVTGAYRHVRLFGSDALGYPHHVHLIDNIMHDSVHTGVQIITSASGNIGGDHIIRGNEFYRTGVGNPGYGPGHNTIYNTGNRSLVERNTFHNLANGVGIWDGVSGNNVQGVTVRYNVCYEIGRTNTDTWLQGNGSFSCVHASAVGGGHSIHHNVAYNSCDAGATCRMFRVWRANPVQNNLDNNTVYDLKNASAAGIMVDAATAGPTNVRNNLVISAGTGITGGTQSNNITSGTASDLFTNPTTYDLSLKLGSAAINAGTSVGHLACSSPDVGAFEVCGPTSAVASGNTVEVSFDAAFPPLLLPGTAGWSTTIGTISGVSRKSGTDSIVVLTLTADCSAGSYTVSYDSGTGTASDSALLGGTHNQPVHTFSSFSITNNCGGSPPTAPPGAAAYYTLDGDVQDDSGNANHGTQNGGTFTAAKFGQGFSIAVGSGHSFSMPSGTVDPSTQSFTLAFGVYVDAADIAAQRTYAGSAFVSGQNMAVSSVGGTWRLNVQNSAATIDSDLAVLPGGNFLVLRVDAASDTATLCRNGVTSVSAGAVKSFTSFSIGDLYIGKPASFLDSVTPAALYDEVRYYTSLQSCADLWDAWEAQSSAGSGTLTQTAIQFQGVILDQAGSPIVVGPSVQTIAVPKRGGVVLLFQVDCGSGTDCDQTAFKLVYSKNGSATKQQVPNTETADGTWMWGVTTESNLNSGIRSTRLTGSCTVEPGATQLTASQVPSLAIPQDRCTVLAYIVHVDGIAGVDYFDYRLQTEAGLDLAGGYTQTARIRVVNPMGGGVGF